MGFEEFKKEYQKAPVEHYPNDVPSEPMVSVCVHTYQHADYIQDCLEGILIQETNFSYEILLGEDASTDGTRRICIEYAEKYPDKIRLFLHSRENNIEIGGRPTGRFNFLYNLYSAQGKYIALCEGDDYWIDPVKLEKQVRFMESKEWLAGCFHASKKDFQNSNRTKIIKHSKDEIFDLGYYLEKNVFMANESLLFKKKVVNSIPQWYYSLFAGDFSLKYFILMEGNVGYINEVMSVYRKGVPGSWSKQKLTQKKVDKEFYDNIVALFELNKATGYRYNWGIICKIVRLYMRYIARSITNVNNFQKFKLFVSHLTLMRTENLKMLIKEFLSYLGLRE